MQDPQQRGDAPRAVQAGVGGGPAGQGTGRGSGPGPTQRPQQLGDASRVVEGGVGGGPAGQGTGRGGLAGPGLMQRHQQPGDGCQVVEGGVGGGPAGQGTGRGSGPGPTQRPQQLGDASRVVEAGVAGRVAGQHGSGVVVGPHRAQGPQQPGDAPGAVEAGVGGGPAGQGTARGSGPGPGPTQRLQEPGDGCRVVEANSAGSPVGGAHSVAWAHPAQESDEPSGGVRTPLSCRCCPQCRSLAVQPAGTGGLPEPHPVPGRSSVGGEGGPQGGWAGLILAGAASVLVEVIGELVSGDASTGCGRGGLQGPDGAFELRGSPFEGGVVPAGDVRGALRAGQVADRRLLEELGGQRAGVAQPGGVHRRGDDRLAVGIAAGPGVAVEQVGDPGQVLGDLAVLPRCSCSRGSCGEHRVAGAGRRV